jgi:small subunit ribosomal protein S9
MAPTTTKETTKEPVKKPVVHRAGTPPTHHAPAHAHTAAHSAQSGIAKGRYKEATGRRKTAVARVRITAGNGKVLVNGKDLKTYFTLPRLMAAAVAPLSELKLSGDFDVSVHVSGGGIHAQAEAVRHGLSQAIVLTDAAWKPRLRAMGYMTRDSRMVERKKYGLKKARRAPQWAKR